MNNKDNSLLSVRDLEVTYSSRGKLVRAVNGVSFDIKAGETLALVGETGAGKTTIAKAILRILPDPPAKIVNGKVLLDGEDLIGLSNSEMLRIRGNRIAMIFQDPMTALNPIQTVGSQIVEGLLLHNDYSHKQAVERASEMLELVGIPASRFDEYPFEFSGGMKQRVVIAMALACNPDVLLADEPTTALDVTIQAQVLSLINQLKKRNNTSLLLITHDLGVVVQMSDYVAVVYAGQIVEYGSKADVFTGARHPYTRGLFDSLPSMSVDAKRLRPIAGSMPDPTALPSGCAFEPRCPYACKECAERPVPMTDTGGGHLVRCIKTDLEV